jgi:hypothetical protein
VAGIDLGPGYSVSATCSWRQNLYDQIRNALDGSLSNDVLMSRVYEEEIGLKYGGWVENQINGCVKEFAEVTVIDMPAKHFEKVCRCALMLRAREASDVVVMTSRLLLDRISVPLRVHL